MGRVDIVEMIVVAGVAGVLLFMRGMLAGYHHYIDFSVCATVRSWKAYMTGLVDGALALLWGMSLAWALS